MNNKSDKDKETEKATIRRLSVPVVIQRNSLDNQRNSNDTTTKREGKNTNTSIKKECEKKDEIIKTKAPNHRPKKQKIQK